MSVKELALLVRRLAETLAQTPLEEHQQRELERGQDDFADVRAMNDELDLFFGKEDDDDDDDDEDAELS